MLEARLQKMEKEHEARFTALQGSRKKKENCTKPAASGYLGDSLLTKPTECC